ncbi:hypothetical protein DesfrDRAFT_1211 [Solidesulfovibrio fructosivorans JJ]]|uniref:Uncharacterized protein n=1 Tax=Solidesulfovibrio fructosivorans JJ] TaxID=596151 RepID=E1JUB2_SOLFR|nr:hypothetical protein [Solidesulfovibrio fructosivorans]EFL52042.1 hypothetical protein DesfrDRAFT_1211 [Solidesulfovibrio fructosivorans JJ]]
MGVRFYPGWQTTLPVGPRLFDFYDSQGDVTIANATSIPTTLDGPIQVARFGRLTVNAALTASNRCRGLMILCDSLIGGAAGSIAMYAKGAIPNFPWPLYDVTIPNSIVLQASKINQQDVLGCIRKTGTFLGDPVFWQYPDAAMADCVATLDPGLTLISAAGCGAATAPNSLTAGQPSGQHGATGNAGAKGPGSGASAAAFVQPTSTSIGGRGERGYPWGGGRGGQAANGYGAYGLPGDCYGVTWGVGGNLIIVCRGDITLAAGFVRSTNGVSGYSAGDGGSGAGANICIYGGTKTDAGTATANGGYSVPLNGYYGGPGGAAPITEKNFAQMGWAA